MRGEFGLAAALMGECQEIDHQPAGWLLGEPVEQPVEGLPIGLAREELVAVDEVEQRHGFAPQGVDHMAIIDDMTVLAVGIGTPARQGHERRAADEQIEAVIVKPDPQPVADEPRWHGVEHLPQREAARGGDADERLLIIAGTLPGQRLQGRPLGLDAFGVAERSCG